MAKEKKTEQSTTSKPQWHRNILTPPSLPLTLQLQGQVVEVSLHSVDLVLVRLLSPFQVVVWYPNWVVHPSPIALRRELYSIASMLVSVCGAFTHDVRTRLFDHPSWAAVACDFPHLVQQLCLQPFSRAHTNVSGQCPSFPPYELAIAQRRRGSVLCSRCFGELSEASPCGHPVGPGDLSSV